MSEKEVELSVMKDWKSNTWK